MRRKYAVLWILLSISLFAATAQEKRAVTMDDIYRSGTFRQNAVYGINWMNDGRYYSSQVTNEDRTADIILKYDITSGEVADTILNGAVLIPDQATKNLRINSYAFSADEQKILIGTEVESIYRRSSKGQYYIYDLKSKKLQKLTEGGAKQSYATFSPQGSKVAFVRENDLFYVDLEKNEEIRITDDGKWNHIINGFADWVYEEEFSMSRAFWWAPDGEKIAYIRFDESEVKEFNMQTWGSLYPEDYKFKYPKAGESNSVVSVNLYRLADGKKLAADIGRETDIYIPRLYWMPDSKQLSIIRMNRLQNKLEILHADVQSGKTNVVLTEESKTYVDINYTDDLTYLADGKTFIRTSEKDGYKHIYHHKLDGSLIRQITSGSWEVLSFLGIDEKSKTIYYSSAEDSPLERHLYSIKLNGKGKTKLSKTTGVHSINFSKDFSYFIDSHSSVKEPLTVELKRAPKGDLVKVLAENSELKQRVSGLTLGEKTFFTYKTTDGTDLNAYMIRPHDFDESKKYPVLMFVYGGPGSQTVMNSWIGGNEIWMNYLTQKGYIIVSVDNRGTGARGRDFKHITYAQLGKYEVEDQIAGAKYLKTLKYIDGDRIGIWGWSYGGYMSSLSLFMGAEYFKAAIAVAPVTSWRYYDTIYTERYLKTPQLNAAGYDDYSPLSHVDKLSGKYLLIHGTGDDNVHFQNAVELTDALIAANKQFESFYYPNRNHGIYGGNTRVHLFNMITDFIEKNL